MLLLLLACRTPDTKPTDDSSVGTDDTPDDTAGATDDSGCDTPGTWYTDADGDGYGDPATALEACAAPEGAVTDAQDCDDTAPTIHPSAEDPCGDGVDADCDGTDACGRDTVADADVHLWSRTPSATAGLLTAVGDVDADGTPDLVVTAPATDSIGGGFVVPGPLASGVLEDVGTRLRGSSALYFAGRSMAVADVDGDGVDDIGWGTPYGTPTGFFVTLGPITGDGDIADAGVSYTGAMGDTAGHGADLADVTGDGAADVLVGAYYAYDKAIAGGSLYFFEGPQAHGQRPLAEADAIVSGDRVNDLVGRFLDGGKDMDGDGIGDVLVGAPYIGAGVPGAGGAYLVLGPPTDGVFADSAAYYQGTQPSGHAGLALAQGDVDGDGLADAIIASDDSTVADTAGVVYIALSPRSGAVDLGASDIVIRGEVASQAVGSAVAAGDADGDGDEELLVGATGDAAAGTNGGAVFYFADPRSGDWNISDADRAWNAEHALDLLGAGVTFADLDGDGRASLLFGARGDSTGASQAGGVYVFEAP